VTNAKAADVGDAASAILRFAQHAYQPRTGAQQIAPGYRIVLLHHGH
jgi:hypothetical protein